jgi:hypothetical protein
VDELSNGGFEMQTLRVTQRAGEDGTLHLSVPLLTPGSEYDVVVVVQSKETDTEPAPPMSKDLGCPPGHVESTFGSINDKTLACPPQGKMPTQEDYPSAPLSEELEIVDWEMQIEPPPRPSRTVVVKFEKGPCRQPAIVADPEE